MTTPNRIVFEATNAQPCVGDFGMAKNGALLPMTNEHVVEVYGDLPAYRRIDAPADSRLLEVATALLAARIASGHSIGALPECVAGAKELIAACEGVPMTNSSTHIFLSLPRTLGPQLRQTLERLDEQLTRSRQQGPHLVPTAWRLIELGTVVADEFDRARIAELSPKE